MCLECGCGEVGHHHANGDHHHHEGSSGHHHHHHDGGAHPVHTEGDREVLVEQRILARNDERAQRNRAWLAQRGVVALNLISSPGTGKTLLLEKTLEGLRGRVACAVITGDQRTSRDAERLQGRGAPVRQIETISACHLNADQVGDLLPEVVEEGVALLFIENVGNLVCPGAFDLGENFKVALLSCTEGEDKPIKYPNLFQEAPVAVLTKMDLAQYVEWDAAQCRRYLQQVHPGLFTFELSAKTGVGMEPWLDYLEKLVG